MAKKQRRAYGVDGNGDKIPSVTEIIKNLGWSAPGLMWWAATEAAKATSEAIKAGAEHDAAVELGRKAHNAKRDAAADAGKLAHAMIEAWLASGSTACEEHDEADEETRAKAQRAADRFVAWWPTSGYTVHLSEEVLFHASLGYAGTCDLVLRDASGELVIADIKTGKAVYDETTIQLAGYGALLAAARGEAVTRGLIIQCPIDDELSTYDVSMEQLQLGGTMFSALHLIHKHKTAIKPRKVTP